MIIKFDGLDGCGKSSLANAVAEHLSAQGYAVAVIAEFSSPAQYLAGSDEPVPIASLQIREAVLDPAFDCDDVERQLLLHFVSRRKNRVEIPLLHDRRDFVIVDRSTISNYAYASAVEPRLSVLSSIAVEGVEAADHIFWVDTPIDVCMARVSNRSADAVESKGHRYFQRVHNLFEDFANRDPKIHRLDGRATIQQLVAEAISVVGG